VTDLDWGCLDTPVGTICVGCGPGGIARVEYGERNSCEPAGDHDLREPPGAPAPGQGHSLLHAALTELEEYFSGRRRSFSVPLDFSALTGPRRAVLSALHGTVGYGETITYGGLADRAGLTGGGAELPARLVGQFMASNPVTIIVPCHRVVAGNGLGGYSGGVGTDTKQWLLIFEGALPPTLDWDPAGLPLAEAPGR
jgi:methylated-DNA-[protein]-cysteine S-methyltransferase